MAGIIVAAAMLVFGIAFFVALDEEGDGIGQVISILYICYILIIIGYYTYALINFDENSDANVGEIIEMENAFNTREVGASFDDKLRKTEQLRKEGLINDEEYAVKRKEIMEQKW